MSANRPPFETDPAVSTSLLWPPGVREIDNPVIRPEDAAYRDLGLAHLVYAFTSDSQQQRDIARILGTLLQDPQVIRYRQDVLADLLHSPGLVERLEALFPKIDALGRYAHRRSESNSLREVTWRLGELQSLVDSVQGLHEALQADVSSQALRSLRAQTDAMQADPVFQNLVRELPGMLERLRSSASITIGVNLDEYLRPVEATLLAVNREKFTSPTLLERLLGKKAAGQAGLAPLHSVPRRSPGGVPGIQGSAESRWAVEPLMVPLFADLAKVIEKTTAPVVKELRRYSNLHSKMFITLGKELSFYLGAVRLVRKLQEMGIPVCRPELAPVKERLCKVTQSCNVNLALRLGSQQSDSINRIVLNDIHIGPAGRILILTGPNQGGKTTYLQGVGLVQVLAQAGLYVPGESARISPVDRILTHFPLEENPAAGSGRFGEETQRLSELFAQVTASSLVLLNETFSSTSAGESIYLAQDVVRILRRLGARALYATHLHELAAQAEALNPSTPGDSLVISLVASPIDELNPDGHRHSFRVVARPPLGRSFARELAARYGVSYEQLEQMLKSRGLLPPDGS